MKQVHQSTKVRQKQIVAAAQQVIIRWGSENVTIRRIAQEISVSEGALYRHFKSKKDILSLLVDDIGKSLLSQVETNLAVPITLEKIERVITDHMSQVTARRGVSFQVMAEIVSLGDNELNRKVYNIIDRYTDCIRNIFSDGIKGGVLKPDVDLKAAAMLFFGMTQGLVNVWTLSAYSFDFEKEYQKLWNVFRWIIIKQ